MHLCLFSDLEIVIRSTHTRTKFIKTRTNVEKGLSDSLTLSLSLLLGDGVDVHAYFSAGRAADAQVQVHAILDILLNPLRQGWLSRLWPCHFWSRICGWFACSGILRMHMGGYIIRACKGMAGHYWLVVVANVNSCVHVCACIGAQAFPDLFVKQMLDCLTDPKVHRDGVGLGTRDLRV